MEILHFWAQFARFGAYFLPTLYWKSLDLFPIKMLFFFNYGRTIWKWVINPAHASPSSSPSLSPFTYYFDIGGILLYQPVLFFVLFLFFFNISCSTEAARCSIVRGQSKSEGPRGSAPWWESGARSPLKLTLTRGSNRDKSPYRLCKTCWQKS